MVFFVIGIVGFVDGGVVVRFKDSFVVVVDGESWFGGGYVFGIWKGLVGFSDSWVFENVFEGCYGEILEWWGCRVCKGGVLC